MGSTTTIIWGKTYQPRIWLKARNPTQIFFVSPRTKPAKKLQRNCLSAEQWIDLNSTGSGKLIRFLLPVFYHSKEMGSNPRSTCAERSPQKYTFRMLTHSVLSLSTCPWDWITSIDLQDVYFHIFPHHRTFLKFAYHGIIYEYLTIPFGLSLVPRVFTKCVEVPLTP